MRERNNRRTPIPVRTAKSRAQILRADPTPAEQVMWGILRDRRLSGIKFRRQKPIGIFVADFYCPELKLVVELDGEVHADPRQSAHDDSRDSYLRSIGCTILRFLNRELFENRETILTKILDTVEHLRSSRRRSPSPA